MVRINYSVFSAYFFAGKKITITDLEDIDADLSKNLRWILENDVAGLDLTFTHEVEELGQRTTRELKEGGLDIIIDESNKKEYVKAVCEARMTTDIQDQLKAFIKGFRMVLSQDMLSIFTASEFEILISGSPIIDLKDMKENTLNNFGRDADTVKWLWEILEEFDQAMLASFVFFVSGKIAEFFPS